MKLVHGKTYIDGQFVENVCVNIKDDKILNFEDREDSDVVDVSGCYVVPGFIDLHFHGCAGADLCDATRESIEKIAKFQASVGTTTICPATMTFSEEILTPIMNTVGEFAAAQKRGDAHEDCANFVGVNMEGPYISPKKIGAQNPEYVRPGSVEEFKRLNDASNNMIKILDVAPEVSGNIEFIKEVVKSGVRCSLAHACATYDEAKNGFDAGVRQVTHLFNAMNPIHHRNPGPIVAAIEDKRVMAEIICDGVHIHPSIIALAFKLFGDDRLILISDTMRACGLPDGTYDLGGQDVKVNGNLATISDGSIAGSVTCLPDCLRYAVKVAKIPLCSAIKCATLNPARALGKDQEIGSIKEGFYADILVLRDDLSLKSVILRGRKVII